MKQKKKKKKNLLLIKNQKRYPQKPTRENVNIRVIFKFLKNNNKFNFKLVKSVSNE